MQNWNEKRGGNLKVLLPMTNSPATSTLESILILGMFRPVAKHQHLTQTLGQFSNVANSLYVCNRVDGSAPLERFSPP